MRPVVCDACRRTVNQRAAGWTTITTRRLDSVDGGVDVCSVACHRDWLNAEYPERRPDFDGTREDLLANRAARESYEQSLDDVDPPPAVEFEGEPVDIASLLARKRSQGRTDRSHASRAADAIREQTEAL